MVGIKAWFILCVSIDPKPEARTGSDIQNKPHLSAFWHNQFKRRIWHKYVHGITDTDRIANKLSPVSEFERRDTEIIDLALELEKLTKSKSWKNLFEIAF